MEKNNTLEEFLKNGDNEIIYNKKYSNQLDKIKEFIKDYYECQPSKIRYKDESKKISREIFESLLTELENIDIEKLYNSGEETVIEIFRNEIKNILQKLS